MKRAIISDIHSNLEALEAVLADIREQGIEEVYCLGDIIGYGPNPRECIDRVMNCNICILGNHDQGALFDPEGFNSGAERAIFWTRDQLEQQIGSAADNARRWDFLGELPRNHRENGFLFVHGSARNPLNEYVFPEDIGYEYRLTDEKVLVNVGSVGQPRDGDHRACYVVLDDETVYFRRLEYPLEQTIEKIYGIPELDNFLGDRLREGR